MKAISIENKDDLKPWAGYFASIDPWKSLDITAEKLLSRWYAPDAPWLFFLATDLENTKNGFDSQHGLIAFAPSEGKKIISQGILKKDLPSDVAALPDGGYVQSIGSKSRRSGVGRCLIKAVEDSISQQYQSLFLFVSESNKSAQYFYKSQGYEEIMRVPHCLKIGNTEILMIKKLTS